MKAIQTISKKAKEIYAGMTSKGRSAWYEAMRQASRIYKALKSGVVTFFKTPKKIDEDVEVTTRKIAPLSAFNYQSKGGEQKPKSSLLQTVVDLEKMATLLDKGFNEIDSLNRSIISFNSWQII